MLKIFKEIRQKKMRAKITNIYIQEHANTQNNKKEV